MHDVYWPCQHVVVIVCQNHLFSWAFSACFSSCLFLLAAALASSRASAWLALACALASSDSSFAPFFSTPLLACKVSFRNLNCNIKSQMLGMWWGDAIWQVFQAFCLGLCPAACSLLLCTLASFMHQARKYSSREIHFSMHYFVYKMVYCASTAETHCCADTVHVTAMLELPWQLACHASPAPF